MATIERDTSLAAHGVRRRELLAGGVAAWALAACRAAAPRPPAERATALEPAARTPEAAPFLAAPDLARERVVRVVVGHRPYRSGRIRLETERIGAQWVVHDYGHGGAGLTLSLGCAAEVRRLVLEHARPGDAVTVLGGGVNGLASALSLVEAGLRPRVVAERFSPHTTSDVAGGQWAPSLVARGDDDASRALFERVLRASRERIDALASRGVGVERRRNYMDGAAGAPLASVPDDVLPPLVELERLPWAGTARAGTARDTYLIEPSRFLAHLTARLVAAGVPFESRRIDAVDELRSLGTSVVVDCLGAGAGPLFGDPAARVLKGHLVLFPPGEHPWLLSHADGYVFPRSDAVVVGGSVESGVEDERIDAALAERIRRANARFFGQDLSAVARALRAAARA